MSKAMNSEQLNLFAEEIRARVDQKRDQSTEVKVPTCPDTSLPWQQDYAHGGFSARMFLHQMMCGLLPHWKCSDTEQLLSVQTPFRLQLKNGGGISLSDQLLPIGSDHSKNIISSKALAGMMIRLVKRHRPVFVLLRTDNDTIPATITFTNLENLDSLTVSSVSGLQDSLTTGLMECLQQELRKCVEMR